VLPNLEKMSASDHSPVQHLPAELLTKYANTFFGFGHWKAPIWFVGIEEAGGETIEEVHDRIQAWAGFGQSKVLQDAPQFYPASRQMSWHGPKAKPQDTWKQLIRVLLVARGQNDTPDMILNYQRNRLGAADGETCLLELFPLPSPSVDCWNYADWSKLPWLQTRTAYEQNVLSHRISLLRQSIDHHRPRVVIFYGDGQLKHWQRIIGPGTYQRPIADKLIAHERNRLHFFITKHPTNPNLRPTTDDYFREIGAFLRNKRGTQFL